jgi:hypothetical protein
MAKDDQKSGIGLADADKNNQAEDRSSASQPPSTGFSKASMKPELVYFGKSFLNGSLRIDSMVIDGQPADGSSAVISRDSEIILHGSGLDALDELEIERSGQGSLIFSKIISKNSGQVILNVADAIGGSLKDQENVGLGFYATKLSKRERILNIVFEYSGGTAEEQKKKRKVQDEEDKIKGLKTVLTPGPTSLVMGAMGGVIGEIAKATAGIGGKSEAGKTTPGGGTTVPGGKEVGLGGKSGQSDGKSAGGTGVAPLPVLAGQTDDGSDMDEGDFEPAGEPEKPAETFTETSRQSGERVADFLRENSQVTVGPKVLAALQSGKLENLTETEKVSLESVVKSLAAGQGGAPLEVMAAAQRVIESQSSQAETESEIKTGDQTVGGEINQPVVQTEIKPPASEPGVKAVDKAVGGAVNQPVVQTEIKTSAGSVLSASQSAKIVAKFLRENPQIKVDAKVLAALQSGDLSKLTVQEVASLKSIMSVMAQGQGGATAEVMAAAQMVVRVVTGTILASVTGVGAVSDTVSSKDIGTSEVSADISSQTSGAVSGTAKVRGGATSRISGTVEKTVSSEAGVKTGGSVKVEGGAEISGQQQASAGGRVSSEAEINAKSETEVAAQGSVKVEGGAEISGQQQASAGGRVSSEAEINAKSETEVAAQGSAKAEAISESSVSSKSEESSEVGATTNVKEKVSGSEEEKTAVSGELETESDQVSPQETTTDGELTADIDTNLKSTLKPETGEGSENLEEPQPSLRKGAVDGISVEKETAGQPEEEAAPETKATADVSKQTQAATKPLAKSETEIKQPQSGGGTSEIAKRLKDRGLELEMTLRGKLAGPSLNVSDQKQKPGGEQKKDGDQNRQEPVRSKTGPSTERGMSAPLGDLPRSRGQEGRESAGRQIDAANRPQEPLADNGKKSQAEAQDRAPDTSSGDGGGGLPGSPLERGETRDLESSSGATLPPSESNRDRGNVFKDPRSAGDMFGEALKGDVSPNPAAYPTARRQIDLAGKGIGKASSKIWYYGFGSATATFFTGADFMLGAVVMDAYWLFGHKKNPDLFPLKGWQKAVTIAANLIPPILITILIYIVLLVGCNWPIPAKYSKIVDYKVTVIGAFIGDNCKYFDITSIGSTSGGGSSGGGGASSNWGTTPTAAIPATSPGSSPSTGTTPPTSPTANSSGILSFIKSWNGPEVYPAVDWGNSDPNIDPSIKANLNELQTDFNSLNTGWQQAGHPALKPKQVYRPEAYQEHYRSIWEIFAVTNGKDDTQGYLCDQTSHLDPTAVAQAYSQASAADKQTLQSLYTAHEISLTSTPAGCVSDHASGIAMDIADQAIDGFNTSLYPALKSTAQTYGMCHNISGDQPHFALTDKLPAGTSCSQP